MWILREIEDFTYAQIANVMAVTPDAVRGLLERARTALAIIFEGVAVTIDHSVVGRDVVVGRVREAIDAVPHAAAVRITCGTDDHQQLDTVTIQIIAAYGSHLLTLAEHVHMAAARTLTDVLGELAPSLADIHTHVHVGDVTDDPRDVL